MEPVYNMRITVQCSRCGKECPVGDPFRPSSNESPGDTFFEDLRRAYIDHNKRDECNPVTGA